VFQGEKKTEEPVARLGRMGYFNTEVCQALPSLSPPLLKNEV